MRAALGIVAIALGACGDDAPPPATPDSADPPAPLGLRVLSSRPEYVTANDALVEVRFADGVDPSTIVVTAGDMDVTSAFAPAANGARVGLVVNLPLGSSELRATIPEHAPVALAIVNHAPQGPLFSGPHQMPFLCRTRDAGLGDAGPDCFVATRYEHYYKNTQNQFVALPDPTTVPADKQQVKRADGVMIDYVVRVERGVINRAIYQITTLFDPTQPEWTATAPQPQWVKKLVYSFKGGCGEGHHQGVLNALDELNGGVFPLGDAAVGAGFAIASASLNTLGTNCNDVLAAETAMMVKERFVERYGVPIYTTGWGGSGGSIQQHLIAENYPGILDGIVPIISYPDVFSIYPDVMDCPLLVDYFQNRAGGAFTVANQIAASGYATETTCPGWNSILGHSEDPTVGCDPAIPAELIYHPTTNPTGIRCTFVDNNINLIGAAPNGRARRIYDNVGVQYGLAAALAGQITVEQFVHLNETIGGYGTDGAIPAPRSAADPEALRAAYRRGRVVRGNLGLAATPIVDLRLATDQLGDFHDRVRSFSLRARLQRANGHTDNHVMIVAAPELNAYTQAAFGALIVIDAWLVALAADPNPDRAAAVRATRPANLTDLCVLPGMTDPKAGACEAEYPPHATPRLVAGAPLVHDILKCTLKPLVRTDYPIAFTNEQWNRMRATFPSGVCDYTQPGVEAAPADGTWLVF